MANRNRKPDKGKFYEFTVRISKAWAIVVTVLAVLALSKLVDNVVDDAIRWYGILANLDVAYVWIRRSVESILFSWWIPNVPPWITNYLILITTLHHSIPKSKYLSGYSMLWSFPNVLGENDAAGRSLVGHFLTWPLWILVVIFRGSLSFIFKNTENDMPYGYKIIAIAFWKTALIFLILLILNYQILARWWPDAL